MPIPGLDLVTTGPEDTRELAATLAGLLRPGDVVALSGELGAGKTCFVQGALRGLGVTARVTSPTFVLVRQYAGRLPVVHCDVYRLERLRDVHELGEDVLAPDVVTFIEWADAVRPLLPEERLEVELLLPAASPAGDGHDLDGGGGDDLEDLTRRVSLRASGSDWAERTAELVAACGAWRSGPDDHHEER